VITQIGASRPPRSAHRDHPDRRRDRQDRRIVIAKIGAS